MKRFNSMKTPYQHSGFTLVEIIISITILSIIMISVMLIFSTSSSLSMKIDINRSMQENVKNIVEDMAENVRKNGIAICGTLGVGADCYDMSLATGQYITSDTLYTSAGRYYLGKQTTTGAWVKVVNISDCENIETKCSVVKDGQHPLSNENVVLRNLAFYVSNEALPKVTISFAIEPSPRRGVQSNLIENNTLYFQTTITQRIIKEK